MQLQLGLYILGYTWLTKSDLQSAGFRDKSLFIKLFQKVIMLNTVNSSLFIVMHAVMK